VIDLLESYGSPELSGWRQEKAAEGREVFWIQTTSRRYARKLRKRKDTRVVGVTGFNHFRETFELTGTWRKIKRIIDHYLLSAGDRFLAVKGLVIALESNARHIMSPIEGTVLPTTDDMLSQSTFGKLPADAASKTADQLFSTLAASSTRFKQSSQT
jgi:hypothetical protein